MELPIGKQSINFSPTVATNYRGRYTVEEVSPLNPANQPPRPPSLCRCLCCLFSSCRCVGRRFCDALWGGGRGKHRTFVIGGLTILALAGINRFLMSPAIEGSTAGDKRNSKAVDWWGFSGIHRLVREQSYGLLRDVPRRRWQGLQREVKRRRDRRTKPREPSEFAGGPSDFYAAQWSEEFACPHQVRVGATGNGVGKVEVGWEMCNPGGIAVASSERQKRRTRNGDGGCLVYSSTESVDFSLEVDLLDAVGKSCEIHAFRPRPGPSPPKGVKVHGWGFKGSQLQVQGEYKSMQQTVVDLGHEGRTIDAFLLDCPGCEWDIYRDWFNMSVSFQQMLVKVHDAPPVANDFFLTIQSHGYVIFHKETDLTAGKEVLTYSFLKLKPDFFS